MKANKKKSPRRRPTLPLPTLTVSEKPPVLDGGRALAVCHTVAANLLVNSDVWQVTHELHRRLFADADVAFAEHKHTVESLPLSPRQERALEASEWAHWHRVLQAAYVLGLAVGLRSGASGGTR